MKLGQAGKGVFWDLVEMLYEQGGKLMRSECESYAFALRVDCETLLSVINDFDLFKSDDTHFWSESVLRRIELRNTKSVKAKESAQKRWSDANAMRTHSEGNAIKEKKRKEKEIKESKGARAETHDLSESNLFRKPTIPTQEQVSAAFVARGGTAEMAEKFYATHSATNWYFQGSPIKNFTTLIPGYITGWLSRERGAPAKRELSDYELSILKSREQAQQKKRQ